jgi:hypothetical protein
MGDFTESQDPVSSACSLQIVLSQRSSLDNGSEKHLLELSYFHVVLGAGRGWCLFWFCAISHFAQETGKSAP